MTLPTLHRLTFQEMDHLSTGAVELTFTASRSVRHSAGQHGIWVVPGGGGKPFTIASAPGAATVRLLTSLTSGSRFKRALSALEPGDGVRLAAPLGAFTLDPTASSTVMLSQGLGISPFLAMLREEAAGAARPPSTLLHIGAAHRWAEVERVAAHASLLRSSEAFAEAVDRAVADQPSAQFLVAGSRAFVADTTRRLRQTGIARRQVATDRPYGLGNPAGAPAQPVPA